MSITKAQLLEMIAAGEIVNLRLDPQIFYDAIRELRAQLAAKDAEITQLEEVVKAARHTVVVWNTGEVPDFLVAMRTLEDVVTTLEKGRNDSMTDGTIIKEE